MAEVTKVLSLSQFYLRHMATADDDAAERRLQAVLVGALASTPWRGADDDDDDDDDEDDDDDVHHHHRHHHQHHHHLQRHHEP